MQLFLIPVQVVPLPEKPCLQPPQTVPPKQLALVSHWDEHASETVQSPTFKNAARSSQTFTCRGDDCALNVRWHGPPFGPMKPVWQTQLLMEMVPLADVALFAGQATQLSFPIALL